MPITINVPPLPPLSEQRDELLFSLGLVVDPIRRLLDDPDFKRKVPFVERQCNADLGWLTDRIAGYCGNAQVQNTHPHNMAHNAVLELRDLFRILHNSTGVEPNIRQTFDNFVAKAKAAIRSLPCENVGQILPGESPLASYRRLLIACRSAQVRVELFDPWLDREPYLRYFDDIDPTVRIRVVTAERVMTEIPRRDRLVDVSELLALERPDNYEFRVVKALHDRHLRIDDDILHLGGSVKDAGKRTPFTISNLDPTATNHQTLDSMIAGGVEWYGPNVHPHRKQI